MLTDITTIIDAEPRAAAPAPKRGAWATRELARTRPWRPDEYLICDGWSLAYVVHGARLLVRMPGCWSASVEQLRELGHTVVMPKTLRREPADDTGGGSET